jgi:hypothetical protein
VARPFLRQRAGRRQIGCIHAASIPRPAADSGLCYAELVEEPADV